LEVQWILNIAVKIAINAKEQYQKIKMVYRIKQDHARVAQGQLTYPMIYAINAMITAINAMLPFYMDLIVINV
jgi:hypothetical protein